MSPSPTDPQPRGRQVDLRRLSQAVAAATAVRRTVSPRPWVGAVVVPDGAPGDHPGFAGATQGRAGTDGTHAEVAALEAAGPGAAGGTLYVTLEPCAHAGQRDRSCADAAIAAGVGRVVVGVRDPDPRVAGRGIDRMRAAGVQVEVAGETPGLESAASTVAEQLAPYLHHRRTGRPLVILKLAASLDGRTAAPDGSSQWITGEEARRDAHRLRADCDAIAVGAGTVRLDDPALTVRLPDEELPPGFVQPLRVVLGSAPADARLQPALELSGPLDQVLDDLGRRGVLQLLVEGGAGLAHDVHQAGLVDRYVLYLAPLLFGGDDARGLFAGAGAPTLADAWRGRLLAVTALGDDLRVELAPPIPPGGAQ
jgi:diaminohydroxyphosphoribosylaminopyrimidine deaminase / 5-amino-6-(5-phosphoribosylamino)uracil reductase